MSILQKVIVFIIGFSGVFYFVRTSDYYSSKILLLISWRICPLNFGGQSKTTFRWGDKESRNLI